MQLPANPIRIAAINNVKDGGQTYLNYLKFALDHLPAFCSPTVFQTGVVGLAKNEAEEFLGREVVEVDSYNVFSNFSSLDFDFILSNDAYVGRLIDEAIKTVFISHGSAPMPANSEYCFSDWTGYWDFILGASKSGMKMAANGLSKYRRDRRNLIISIAKEAIRTDVRTTFLCPIPPLKKTHMFTQPVEITPSRDFFVGILPTALGAIREAAAIYRHLEGIIAGILGEFPNATIIFRPYPLDAQRQDIRQVINIMKTTGRVEIDVSGANSTDFYDRCDVLITDGSTGGMSFMLRKTTPPIYFLPENAVANDQIVQWFFGFVNTTALVAGSLEQLNERIEQCRVMTASERFNFYKTYCSEDLFLERTKQECLEEVFLSSIRNPDQFMYVDSGGRICSPDMEKTTSRPGDLPKLPF